MFLQSGGDTPGEESLSPVAHLCVGPESCQVHTGRRRRRRFRKVVDVVAARSQFTVLLQLTPLRQGKIVATRWQRIPEENHISLRHCQPLSEWQKYTRNCECPYVVPSSRLTFSLALRPSLPSTTKVIYQIKTCSAALRGHLAPYPAFFLLPSKSEISVSWMTIPLPPFQTC